MNYSRKADIVMWLCIIGVILFCVYAAYTTVYEYNHPCKRFESRYGMHHAGWVGGKPLYLDGPYQECVER